MKLEAVSDAIPGLFDEAEENYLQAIDDNADVLKETYQRTLNDGFKGMAYFVFACSLVGLVLLIPYKDRRRGSGDPEDGDPEDESDGAGDGDAAGDALPEPEPEAAA
ncbi:MAG: hypothetical protein Q4D06_05435 [Coriobacteriia bacterium]|nr:hypothetical protein [Coriobacteriia bacterium]